MGTYAESLLTPDEKVIMRQRQHWLALILDSWLAIIFWGATIILIVAQLLLPDEFDFFGLFSLDLGSGSLIGDAGMLLTFLTLLGGIIVVALRWWWWRTQEFLVTNRRLVLAWGVLNKSSSDSSLEKINDAQLDISVLGRLLDYGSLKVMTAAPLQGSDYLDRLNHAKDFKKAMMTAKHELQSGERGDGDDYLAARAPAAAPAGSAPASPAAASPAPGAASATPSAGHIDVSGGSDPLKADTPEEVTAVLAQLTRLRDEGHLSAEDYESKKQELLGRL
jgi:hypothetical protein